MHTYPQGKRGKDRGRDLLATGSLPRGLQWIKPRPDRSQEPEVPQESPMWIQKPKHLYYLPLLSPRHKSRLLIRSGVARPQTGTHMGCCSTGSQFSCCATIQPLDYFLVLLRKGMNLIEVFPFIWRPYMSYEAKKKCS